MILSNIQLMLVVGGSIASLGTLLHIVGLATTHWINVSEGDFHMGLFTYCERKMCDQIPSAFGNDSFNATRAMTLIGVLFAGAGIVSTVVYAVLAAVGKHPSKLHRKLSGATWVAAGIFICIGVTVFATKVVPDVSNTVNLNLGFSFVLSTIAGVLFLCAGVILVAMRGPEDEGYTS